MTRLALTLALSFFALTTAAQVFSWKDADGRVHYSDRPDSGADAKKLGAAVAAPDSADAARKAQAEKSVESRKEEQKAKEAAGKAEKEKSDAAEKRQQCERAKVSLDGIESGQVRFTMGPGGERVALEGNVREAELANARKAVDSWCK